MTELLENKLRYDENGKPVLDLPLSEGIGVRTNSRVFDDLMQVFEVSGKVCRGGSLPNEAKYFRGAPIIKIDSDEKLGFSDGGIHFNKGDEILTPEEFYVTYKVSYEDLEKINDWFENYKPNRASKS